MSSFISRAAAMAGTTPTTSSSKTSSTSGATGSAASTRQELRSFRRDLTLAHLERRVLERQRRSLRKSISLQQKEVEVTHRLMADMPMHMLKRFLTDFFIAYRETRVLYEWFRFGSSLNPAELRHASPESLKPLFNCNERWASPGGLLTVPPTPGSSRASSPTRGGLEADDFSHQPVVVTGEQSIIEIIAKLQKEETALVTAGLPPPPTNLVVSHQTTNAPTSYTEILNNVFTNCQEMSREHAKDWTRESSRRRRYDTLLKDFFGDHEKLMVWCRQQRSTLSRLQSAEDVKEFCRSFHTSTAVMEANFLVLLEMSEALLPHGVVEKKLSEVAAVWLELELSSFERLREVVLDAHVRSGLEADCRGWPDYSRRVKTFLADAERLLVIAADGTRQDPSSKEKYIVPTLNRCRKLLEDHAAHLLIVEHLGDFSLREETTKEHFSGIRKTALSQLTLLTQSFPGLLLTMDYPKKKAYNDAMAELGDWIEVHSAQAADKETSSPTRGTSFTPSPWSSLLERIDTLRSEIGTGLSGGGGNSSQIRQSPPAQVGLPSTAVSTPYTLHAPAQSRISSVASSGRPTAHQEY